MHPSSSKEPDLEIGPLKLWIFHRVEDIASDPSRSNLLHVRVQCRSSRSSVEADGPYLHLSEVASLAESCERSRNFRLSEGRPEFYAERIGNSLFVRLTNCRAKVSTITIRDGVACGSDRAA
jgi:hypothetical protein